MSADPAERGQPGAAGDGPAETADGPAETADGPAETADGPAETAHGPRGRTPAHPEGRLHGIRLGPVRLAVADIDRSLDWYGAVLGLRGTAEEAGPGRARAAALLGGDGAPLVRLLERPGARPHPPRGRLGLFHYAVLLPGRAALGAFYAHARSLGVALGASDHLVSEALYLADPDGLGIEVYADRPREAWTVTARGPRMATLPLNARSLVDAAGGAAWEGPPAGSAIGHVHLHVGDLAAAEAFYGDALGLEPTVRDYPGALFLAADAYHHHLGLNTWAGPGAVPATVRDAALLEWEIVPEARATLRAAAARMREAGFDAPEGGRGGSTSGPPSEASLASAAFTDPWGTTVVLRSRTVEPS